MNKFDFICVSGYGRSGSSACVDILKEFEFIDGLDREFRIVKDPHGILDLELSVVDNWEFVGHNSAINDFLEYCLILSRKDGLFKRVGKNFSELLFIDFMKESVDYINRLNDFKYSGNTLLHRYHLNALQSFKQRLKTKFGFINASPMYFSRPSEEEFLDETRKYLRKIYNNFAAKKNLSKIVLDQAVPPTNIYKTLKFFDNAKIIIIDRDPRDIYATMLNERKFLGVGKNSIDRYIHWHHSVRKQTAQDLKNIHFMNKYVLRLNFEDLFLNYEKTIMKLKDFLDIDFNHKDKGKRFQTESIGKHIGIWKEASNQDDIMQIEKQLNEYCYFDQKNK
jgi:hypothetical protein